MSAIGLLNSPKGVAATAAVRPQVPTNVEAMFAQIMDVVQKSVRALFTFSKGKMDGIHPVSSLLGPLRHILRLL